MQKNILKEDAVHNREVDYEENLDKYLLHSVDNTLKIIDLLGKNNDMGIGEIAAEMKLGKSSVFRSLFTLQHNGYITKDANSRYHLSYKICTLGRLVENKSQLTKTVHPYLELLAQQTGETAHLVVWKNSGEVIFIDKVSSKSTIRMEAAIGFTVPAHISSTGKALLAFGDAEELQNYIVAADFTKVTPYTIDSGERLIEECEQIRQMGYAELNEESELSLTCYAAPIFQLGTVVAAVSISGPTARIVLNKQANVQTLLKAANEINKKL